MANLLKDLNNLDFSVYIGGPLQAAIQAQTAASMATVDFIKEVGFEKGTQDLMYVDFKYKKTDSDSSSSTSYTLSVPLITLLTIPAIRIDEITIDFSAKLTSVDTVKVDSTINSSTSANAKVFCVKMNAAIAHQRKSTTGSDVTKSYDLTVHVRAVNDELPAGLDRIIGVLESEIKDKETKP
jgi:hypothetical protein